VLIVFDLVDSNAGKPATYFVGILQIKIKIKIKGTKTKSKNASNEDDLQWKTTSKY
jgi:hypothetical protein